MKYLVAVPEVHYSYISVESDSTEGAIQKVREGEGNRPIFISCTSFC